VKKLRKSVNICQSHQKNKSGTFFYGPRCMSPSATNHNLGCIYIYSHASLLHVILPLTKPFNSWFSKCVTYSMDCSGNFWRHASYTVSRIFNIFDRCLLLFIVWCWLNLFLFISSL